MSKSKKQRSWIPIEECDRVSSLPDSIICHIFSPFSQPKTPSPQAFSQRDGNHYGSQSSLSISPITNSSHYLQPDVLSHAITRQHTANTITPPQKPNDITELIIAAIQRRTETLELDM